MSKWIDVTRPMGEKMQCWPGRLPPGLIWERRLADGDFCNASAWALSAHTGTHMDAPKHFAEDGPSIDQIPPEVLVGSCRVIDISDDPADACGEGRVLIRSGRTATGRDYAAHEALMSIDAAKALIDSGLLLIGTDRLSVDRSEPGDYSLHSLLLAAGCVVIEGLALEDVTPGSYEIIALPLRFEGAEASPARVLLSRQDEAVDS